MPKILVVDDDWAISEQLKIYLEDLGHDVMGVAESGEKAIDLATELKPDLIIMDIVLPGGIDGIEAAQRIRTDTDIAIVFITGYGEEEFIERAKDLDPFGYILKPYKLEGIRASVEIALHKRETEKKLREIRRQLEQRVNEQTAELSVANERLNALMNATRDEALLIDLDGIVMAANRMTAARYGLSLEEFIGMNIYDLMPPDLVSYRKSRLKQAISIKRPLRFEDQRRRSVFDTTIYPISGDEGEIIQLAVFGKDITAFKQSMAALKKREAELEANTASLQEANTALSVLLRRRENDRVDVEERITANISTWVRPYLRRLKETALDEEQNAYLHALESGLDGITSPLTRDLSSAILNLTPTEIRVAGLVREGKTTKQIAKALSVSTNTVLTHRFRLRTKLGIKGKKVDLKTHLVTFH